MSKAAGKPTRDGWPGVAWLTALACAALLAACGDSGAEVPAACTQGEEAVRRALRSAPGQVRLGGAPLSRCLSEEADGGEAQAVGAGFVEAATVLSRRARRDPEGRAALELGYLVGAARRGSSTSQGIHAELLRRLEQEAGTLDTRSDAFRRGQRAGRSSG
jgi:hypothetical protein